MTSPALAVALACLVSGAVTGAVHASDAINGGHPFYLAGGINYLNSDARDATTDRGIYAALGYIDGASGAPAIAGMPCIDLEWRRASGQGNRIDSYSISYAERIPVTAMVYFGLGLGTSYHRVDVDAVDRNKWRIGGKGLLGVSFAGAFFIEATYHYTGKVSGVDTTGLSFAAGIWF